MFSLPKELSIRAALRVVVSKSFRHSMRRIVEFSLHFCTRRVSRVGKTIVASFRLAVALVCVGASLILGAHWFGMIPDTKPLEVRAKCQLSETIAVHCAAHVRKQQWADLETVLQIHVDRNPDLLSIGLRSDLGVLRIETGHHGQIAAACEATGKDTAGADWHSARLVRVPITLNRRNWGHVELCFREKPTDLTSTVMGTPVIPLLIFFIGTGLIVYTFFVTRILGIFRGTQVVPDRVRQALDTLAEGLLVLDERARIILANRAFADTTGISSAELASHHADELGWVTDGRASAAELPWTRAINESANQTEQMLRYQLPDGSERIFSVNAAPLGSDGDRRGALATFRDVTHVEEHRVELENMLSLLRNSRDEIKRKNGELEILATQDALTGCLNRRAFFERFERLWDDAIQNSAHLATVMVDVDHFKSVNDTYGHQVGDDVLRAVSKAIRDRFHDTGLVCRYGGEEFCIALTDCSLVDAMALAEQLRQDIAAIVFDDPAELKLTASLGVSELRFAPENVQEIITQADLSLYKAKSSGRDCVMSYAPSMVSMAGEHEITVPTQPPVNIPFQAVTALVSTLSYRDPFTAEHSRRVADLCVRAAQGILDAQQTYVLEIAALLHDIGKVGVPDDILLKPGPLNNQEWEVMGRHDRIGVEIVAGAFNCPPLTDLVSMHHAFYGGKARDPELPTGDDIILGARLLTICDSYDAMVSDRVYRKGRSHAEAIAELRRCAGTQFDPELVEHFANVIQDGSANATKGVFALRNQAAIQIGQQVERLAVAIGRQDANELHGLAVRLGAYARNSDIQPVAEAAKVIEEHASSEEIQWIDLLNETRDLMDTCRATQTEFLRDSLSAESSSSKARS